MIHSTRRWKKPPLQTGQRDLFSPAAVTRPRPIDLPITTPAPSLPAGDTRRAARQTSAVRAPTAVDRISVAIAAGHATLDALEAHTALPRSTIGARLSEMETAGLIIDTGRRVQSRYGSPLTVFALATSPRGAA